MTKATFITVDAKGMKSTRGYTAAYDGKDYPYTGNPNADTLAVTGNAYERGCAEKGRQSCSDRS
ncbi:MAG TPA: hypothetical protein VGZ27_05285 [Vicinamibacterales bacterium]|jgi:hypothetical protein|nr:hypothetical protein [Vicinamibacterales bacterium]